MEQIEMLQKELKRAKQLLAIYEDVPEGRTGAEVIKAKIHLAEHSIKSGDVSDIDISIRSLKYIISGD